MLRLFVGSLLSAALLSGCAPREARINHVVLINLANERDASHLLGDCERLLRPIPSVKTFWVGTPLDIGRDAIDGNYTVGLCVGFENVEGYESYLVHPRHLELVAFWKPKWTGARLFDVDSAAAVVDSAP